MFLQLVQMEVQCLDQRVSRNFNIPIKAPHSIFVSISFLEHTDVNSRGNISYTSNDFERISNHSESSTISDISSPYSNDDHIPLYMTSGNSTTSSMLQYNPEDNFGIDASSVVELDNGGRVIFQGKIGIGHYGTVYKGQYEEMDYMQEVAIKTFRAKHDKNIYKDFDREINIMRVS